MIISVRSSLRKNISQNPKNIKKNNFGMPSANHKANLKKNTSQNTKRANTSKNATTIIDQNEKTISDEKIMKDDKITITTRDQNNKKERMIVIYVETMTKI